MEKFLPMLAASAEPFDCPDHLFEIKWDGIRCLSAIQQKRVQLWGRKQADYTGRYPELDVLTRLPSGTVLDGELVVLKAGRADLDAVLRRHQLSSSRKINLARRHSPVAYVAFDLLQVRNSSLMDQPLRLRREELTSILKRLADPGVLLSSGVVGAGSEFFQRAVEQGHEGLVAKHLASSYLPGRRAASWKKIKPKHTILCLVIGYLPARGGGFHSLLLAACHRGQLQYVGRVCCGFGKREWLRISQLLAERIRGKAAVPCPRKAVWVEPDLIGKVRFLSWTSNGRLRGASFAGLIEKRDRRRRQV